MTLQNKKGKTKDDAIPLPDPFPLPKHYQRNVEEALKSGKMLTKERRMFLSDVASEMLRYKCYPSRDDYVSVSCAVIQAHPFLKSTSGRPYVSCCTCMLQFYFIYSSQDAIVQGLVNRFKEFRRDKSKPRAKPSGIACSHSKEKKSPGITKQLDPPLLQVSILSLRVDCKHFIPYMVPLHPIVGAFCTFVSLGTFRPYT